MNDFIQRWIEPGAPPSLVELETWLGKKAFGFWQELASRIEQNYPEVFEPEWLYGGKKHGWSLRYKKSKSFCTLVPEKGTCKIVIVFGAAEREQFESIRQELSAATQAAYDEATTYHDGKWLLLTVDKKAVVADVEQLLTVKRKPSR